MRCIAQYEDILCELSHEVKRTGNLSPEISDEVLEILEKIPSQDYIEDLDAVRATLVDQRPTINPSRKRSAKTVLARRSSTAKKKPGRKSSR
jgi:hypothetical protein